MKWLKLVSALALVLPLRGLAAGECGPVARQLFITINDEFKKAFENPALMLDIPYSQQVQAELVAEGVDASGKSHRLWLVDGASGAVQHHSADRKEWSATLLLLADTPANIEALRAKALSGNLVDSMEPVYTEVWTDVLLPYPGFKPFAVVDTTTLGFRPSNGLLACKIQYRNLGLPDHVHTLEDDFELSDSGKIMKAVPAPNASSNLPALLMGQFGFAPDREVSEVYRHDLVGDQVATNLKRLNADPGSLTSAEARWRSAVVAANSELIARKKAGLSGPLPPQPGLSPPVVNYLNSINQQSKLALCDSPHYAEIYQHIPCRPEDATAAQLADRSRPTSHNLQFLISNFADDAKRDLSTRVDNLNGFQDPGGERLAAAIQEFSDQEVPNIKALAAGSLTWGEFNQRRSALSQILVSKQQEIAKPKDISMLMSSPAQAKPVLSAPPAQTIPPQVIPQIVAMRTDQTTVQHESNALPARPSQLAVADGPATLLPQSPTAAPALPAPSPIEQVPAVIEPLDDGDTFLTGAVFASVIGGLHEFDVRVRRGDNILHITLAGDNITVHSLLHGGTGHGHQHVSGDRWCLMEMTPHFEMMSTCFRLVQSRSGNLKFMSDTSSYFLTLQR